MTPHFKTVPDHWKAPEGPYRQAPNGEWWLVSPFGSDQPWLTQSQPPKGEVLPEGFEDIYGPRPLAQDYRGRGGHARFQVAVADWERNLKFFKGAGRPEWATEEEVEAANEVFFAWDMGEMRLFEGRYGWSAMFPDSAIPDFDCPAKTAVESSHLIIAQYQLALLERGVTPEKRHPFVPPSVWPDYEGKAE